MTPVELKLTLDDETGALVIVGQWALLEKSWGSRAGLPSANFDILPSGNTTSSWRRRAHSGDDLEERPLTVALVPNHPIAKHCP